MKRTGTITIFLSIMNFFNCGISEAIVVNADWKVAGDGLTIFDITNNTKWLDLTETANLSMDYVSEQLGVGGEFEGWRFATAVEVHSLLVSSGVTNFGWHADNVAIAEQLFDIWGELGCTSYPRSARVSYFNYVPQPDGWVTGAIGVGGYSWYWGEGFAWEYGIRSFDLSTWVTSSDPLIANALILVPEPVTLALFGAGVVMLRRKKLFSTH
jgi:hypothetical protein